jgi:nicotinamidase-related amidase
MQALLVVDAQNEFSADGLRPVPNHADALQRIHAQVARARQAGDPIGWVQHFNRPTESRAFVPGSWGAELSPGLGPRDGQSAEALFTKDVFGAFTGTGVESWLREQGVTRVLLVGFYTHMCLSTTAREALIRGFDVVIDHDGTGACALKHELLGMQSADDVRRSALLQLVSMGATVVSSATSAQAHRQVVHVAPEHAA